MAKWKTVEDKNVQHIWKCTDGDEGCDFQAEVTPDWYQNNGTPVCNECDRDMEYVRTEVRN